MSNFLKKIAVSLIAFSFVFAIAALSACREDYLPEYESGYFRYAVRTEKDGNKKAYIIGFTKLGEQQKVLVYPEYIDAIKVYGMFYEHYIMFGSLSIGEFRSDKLEKFFFPKMPEERTSGNPRLSFSDAYAFFWDTDGEENQLSFMKGVVYSYDYWMTKIGGRLSDRRYIANVSYMYNYENAENNGYYWVDSYDNDVITFIPPNPERLGYLFGGWYKEPECINQWNFETDKTGKLLNNETYENFATYEGTYLYAKWIKNS
ncbi:MAG TPA: InlB B-repeat-containing protein [Candidatus Coproplasma excrementavium]|nr:InlB B-repeat-containing protein [Candidatus Coproplasma excrementavium]